MKAGWRRTHTCGELRISDEGQMSTLMGWVNRRRDHGGLIFIDIRDRYGYTQIVFTPDNPDLHQRAHTLRPECVIAVRGVVRARPEEMRNPTLSTGDIELRVEELDILSESETPPFVIENEVKATEETRLRYRFLDLRREPMKRNVLIRHQVCSTIRRYLNERNFVEIETPVLTRSTPEGARDYLVPSRHRAGSFYCLAQSPQLYKQILMIAGFDRYYQLARCFRDEDQRADRQPEHTQIDIEMSFVHEDEIFELVEGLMHAIFSEAGGIELEIPFPRLTHQEALDRYGTDKPDLRYGLEIVDVDEVARGSSSKIFQGALDLGGTVRAINVAGKADLSRKQIEGLEAVAQRWGAKGLLWCKLQDGGWSGPAAKQFDERGLERLSTITGAVNGDLLLIVAGPKEVTLSSLGAVRSELGRVLALTGSKRLCFCWITDFLMFEWSEEEGKWEPSHHLFTMPREEDLDLLETDPGRVRGRLYDLVANGVELASGSIRNHRRDIQERVMNVVGMSHEEAEEKFGFLLDAFQYGAPPHGGIAPGLDRIIMLLTGNENLRDVIPFPKTLTGMALMEGAPAPVMEEQLREAHIQVLPEEEGKERG